MFRAKKIAFAVAMAAATMSMAQATEVEVFGRIDTGILYTANAGDSKDNFQMTSGHLRVAVGVSRQRKSSMPIGPSELTLNQGLTLIPANWATAVVCLPSDDSFT